MIGSLRGALLDRTTTGEVLVEVAGVGYRVQVGPSTSVTLGDLGAEVFVWVHHHVREDAETLYGFATRDERVCFEALLGAHGVGPSLALAILSVHGPAELARVLADDDIDALCLVPGVGKKTAARLLIELKSRLDVPALDGALATVAGNGNGNGTGPGSTVGGVPTAVAVRADVRDALVGLGYSPEEIREALRDLPDGDDPAELLRVALQRLAVR